MPPSLFRPPGTVFGPQEIFVDPYGKYFLGPDNTPGGPNHACRSDAKGLTRTVSNSADGRAALRELLQDGSLSDLDLRALFDSFDADESGTIDVAELQALAHATGVSLKAAQATATLDKLDTDGDGKIQFSEFEGWHKDLPADP